jgi:hypothetical protein
MVTKRDVKKPEDKLIPAYPQCGTCPYALIDGERIDPATGRTVPQLWCHGAPPAGWPIGPGMASNFRPVFQDKIGCQLHPLWPAELRKPYIDASKRLKPRAQRNGGTS